MHDDAPDQTLYEHSGLASWNPVLVPLLMQGRRETRPLPGWRAVVRSDDGSPLGVVSRGYQLVRNREIWEWFRSFADEGGMRLSTAGSLCNGRRVWALAKLPETFTLPGTSDRTDMYACMSTGHDGTFATQVDLTSVRVVCHNTLDATRGVRGKGGEGEKWGRYRRTHLGRWDDAAKRAAHRVVSEAREAARLQAERAERLYAARAEPEVQQAYLVELFAPEIVRSILDGAWGVSLSEAVGSAHRDAGARVLSSIIAGSSPEQERETGACVLEVLVKGLRRPEIREVVERKRGLQEVTGLLGRTPGSSEVRGTLWDAANTVSYYVDHVRGRDASASIESALWGDGRSLKAEAFRLADDYAARLGAAKG